MSIRPTRVDLEVIKLEWSLDMFFEIGKADIDKLHLMKSITDNELFPGTTAQAQEISEVTLIPPMRAMKARADAHSGMTLHCFKTKFKMDREDFETMISIMDVSESTKQLFLDSKF